jgi:hypothetical protein
MPPVVSADPGDPGSVETEVPSGGLAAGWRREVPTRTGPDCGVHTVESPETH